MTTLVGLHELHRSSFPHQVFGRQPPPRSTSVASPWPRSGPVRRLRFCWLLRGSAGLGALPFLGCRIHRGFPRDCPRLRGVLAGIPFSGAKAGFFSASRHVSVSVVGCSFVVAAGCSHALWVRGAFGAIDLQLPWCLFPRLLNLPAVLSDVRLGVGVSSRPFTCVGCFVWFVSRFHLDTDSYMAVFALGHLMELCSRWRACCLPSNSLHARDEIWTDTSYLHTTTTTTTTQTQPGLCCFFVTKWSSQWSTCRCGHSFFVHFVPDSHFR